MVSLLDSGLGEFLIPIFLFILIYAIIYAALSKTKFFGDSININAIIAFAMAALFAAMPGAMEFISVIAPWFIIMVMVAFSVLLIFMFGGLKGDVIESIFKNTTVYWTIIILSIIIVVGGLTVVYGPFFVGGTPEGEGAGPSIHKAIFNVKVLTTIVVLIIFSFAVRLLSFESLRD
ncbi:hypothetical protein J4443_03555 [Candidatus Woesearchaeota archaeon]|nr:hypothetical protein [Candidatus Woesearchaeota archaeon]